MKKQYTTEQEILDDIEAARKKIAVLENEAAALDAGAEECFKNSIDPKNNEAESNWLREQGQEKRNKANHSRMRVSSLMENRLTALGSTLAAFRTEPMFFLNGDKTVAIQK